MGGVFTRVKGRDRPTLRQRGPCLACRVPDIQYGTGRGRGLAPPHAQFGDPWLDSKVAHPLAKWTKPFVFIDTPDRLHGQGLTVRYTFWNPEPADSQIHSVEEVPYPILKPYLCAHCRLELEAELATRIKEAIQRKRIEVDRRRYEATWRHPRPGEFAVESGHRKFALVAPTLSFRSVEFHWRTSKLFCRGSSPAFIMLMAVDGVFSGKCCRTYEAVGGYGNESIPAEEYAATSLLAQWIQKNLQTDLRSIDPLFVWDASKPAGCGFDGGNRKPGVIQTTWVDGTRFAAVVGLLTIPAVANFLETVGYKLLEQRERQKPVGR